MHRRPHRLLLDPADATTHGRLPGLLLAAIVPLTVATATAALRAGH
ncbi:hypothetical protein [Streptomyces sp. NPDC127038]